MSILKRVAVLIGLAMLVGLAQAETITLLSDRSEFHLKPLIQQFEQQTGYTVKAIFVDEGGLPARLAARPDEADVVVTTDIVSLELARRAGFLQPLHITSAVPKQFKDPNNYYTAISYRARTMIVPANSIDQHVGYDDLGFGKYRVCMRPLNHAYNINLVAQMIASRGETYARRWLAGVKANLAMTPTGNDRKQAEFVATGKCDVSLMNTYYFGQLQTSKSQREFASKVSLFFPDQATFGTYILESGAAITKSGNAVAASRFIDYLLGPLSQAYVTNTNYEYPVMDVPVSNMVKSFAEGQVGVKDGVGKLNHVSIQKIADARARAVALIESMK